MTEALVRAGDRVEARSVVTKGVCSVGGPDGEGEKTEKSTGVIKADIAAVLGVAVLGVIQFLVAMVVVTAN